MAVSLKDIRSRRALRRLCEPSHLAFLLDQPCGDEDLRAQIAAEVVVRTWLLSGHPTLVPTGLYDALDRALLALNIVADARAEVRSWCESQAKQRVFGLPDALVTAERPVFKLVEFDLNNWQSADGCITFLPNVAPDLEGFANDGVALPFVLDDSASRHTCLLRTADDQALVNEGLDRSIRIAQSLAELAGWRREGSPPIVKLLTVSGAGFLPLVGESGGLAILLALAVRCMNGQEGSIFRVGASGVLAQNGSLVPLAHDCEGLLAKERLLLRMGVSQRFLPAGPAYQQGTVAIPSSGVVGALEKALKAMVPRIVRESADRTLTLNDMENRLKGVNLGMRYGSIAAGESRHCCEEILNRISDATTIRAADLRTHARVTLAAAECHAGHPEQSMELCRSVTDDPGSGARFKVQALVRQVVNLTDLCRYEDAVRMAQDAGGLVALLSSTVERKDAELQISGSIGQALCYWAMLDPTKTQQAMHELLGACVLAKELDGDAAPEIKDEPRNQCYRYLAYALLIPWEAESVFLEVRDICSLDPKTLEYLRRTRWLSAYRLALLGRRLPDSLNALDMELPLEGAEGGWLHQTAVKYRGTLRAARGDIKGALRDFSLAAKLLTNRMPLIEFIGATAVLQAGESLMRHAPIDARAYLESAVTVFERRREWFAGPLAGECWLVRAQEALAMGNGEPARTPQLLYPY